MGLEEQTAVFDEYHARAYEMALDSMAANHDRIARMARERLTAGAAQFGDRMFRAAPEVLHGDALEEFADALNYWVAKMWSTDQRNVR